VSDAKVAQFTCNAIVAQGSFDIEAIRCAVKLYDRLAVVARKYRQLERDFFDRGRRETGEELKRTEAELDRLLEQIAEVR